MEISITPFLEIKNAARWDSEFYRPDLKGLIDSLKANHGRPLREFVIQAQRGQAPAYNPDGEIPIIRTVNVREVGFSDARQEFVSRSFFDAVERGKVERGDIVVTSTGLGTLGRSFCNISEIQYFADGHITILKLKPDVDFAFLTAVLQSSIGLNQFEQWQRGSSGQIEIYPEDILSVLIPDFSNTLRRKISSLWLEGVALALRSNELYPEAEAELLERMKWAKIAGQPMELSYVTEFAQTKRRERYDAEHFQPQYTRLRTHLQEAGSRLLGIFCPIPQRGVQPVFVEGGDVLVIDSKAVRPQGVEPSETERTNLAFYSTDTIARGQIRQDDVLLNSTGLGTLGRAACYQLDQLAIADNHVAIIRPDQQVCLPVYLSLFLNSPAGLAQSEMYQTGSSGQLELYPQHISQFLIYLPKNKNGEIDLAWQEKLARKVIAANTAKIEARARVEEAKRLVEEAIFRD